MGGGGGEVGGGEGGDKLGGLGGGSGLGGGEDGGGLGGLGGKDADAEQVTATDGAGFPVVYTSQPDAVPGLVDWVLV